MSVPIPAIPDISGQPSLSEIAENLRAIRHALEIREGIRAPRTNSRAVTIQDLIDAGVIQPGDIV